MATASLGFVSGTNSFIEWVIELEPLTAPPKPLQTRGAAEPGKRALLTFLGLPARGQGHPGPGLCLPSLDPSWSPGP